MADKERYELRWLSWKKLDHQFRRSPESTVVERFADREAALAALHERESQIWAAPGFNPFQYGGMNLFFQSTMPAEILCDWLLDHEFQVPTIRPVPEYVLDDIKQLPWWRRLDSIWSAFGTLQPMRLPKRIVVSFPEDAGLPHADWVRWWDEQRPTMSPDKIAVVREALNKVRFFEIVDKSPTPDKLYLVTEINWTWNDGPLEADPEGGTAIKAFRSRANADAHCAELNAAARRDNPHSFDSYDYARRTGHEAYAPQGYLMAGEAVFFEVVEIDAEAGPAGGRA